jgi:hypothetical protein
MRRRKEHPNDKDEEEEEEGEGEKPQQQRQQEKEEAPKTNQLYELNIACHQWASRMSASTLNGNRASEEKREETAWRDEKSEGWRKSKN